MNSDRKIVRDNLEKEYQISEKKKKKVCRIDFINALIYFPLVIIMTSIMLHSIKL